MISWFMGSSPASGSALTGLLGIISFPLSLPSYGHALPPSLSLTLSLSLSSKHEKIFLKSKNQNFFSSGLYVTSSIQFPSWMRVESLLVVRDQGSGPISCHSCNLGQIIYSLSHENFYPYSEHFISHVIVFQDFKPTVNTFFFLLYSLIVKKIYFIHFL